VIKKKINIVLVLFALVLAVVGGGSRRRAGADGSLAGGKL